MGYAKELKEITISVGITELPTSNAYVEYDTVLVKMEDGYKQDRKNPFTDELAMCVQDRGNTFNSVDLTVQSFINSKGAAEAAAAKKLNILLSKYKAEFSKSTYSGATGMISSFIEDIKLPENAEAIATLKMEKKIEQLIGEQKEYVNTYLQCIAKDMESEATVVASKIRNEFLLATRSLFLFVGVKAKENPNSKWSELNTKIAIHNAKFEKKEAVRQAALKKKRDEKKNKQ